MSHQELYHHNKSYAEFLSERKACLYDKYIDSLSTSKPDKKVLDIGCGVGQVVHRLVETGVNAYGVDVSETNVQKAAQTTMNCRLYDGQRLPFPDQSFANVGALNVLEHVEEPEAFITEMVRVTETGGKVVISSPNFLRVIGFGDYHSKMRGITNKWHNWRRFCEKRRQIKNTSDTVRFDHMIPLIKEPIAPDDDAIVATNALEIKFFLERSGCSIESVECTDRYIAKPIDFLVNSTPLRYLMLNAFVAAHRIA